MARRILTVVGARPQFIKAAVVSKAIVEHGGLEEIMVHTGQHFDAAMSDVFFGQLGIPAPRYNLSLGGGSHGRMTGQMLERLEAVLLDERPDRVLVYGDTNSTLAGALAAVKLHIPVAHVEAGLRSFDRRMPEEINRVLTDEIADLLFCPTQEAIRNLRAEGIEARKEAQVHLTGDVMEDCALVFRDHAVAPAGLSVDEGFILATVHRAENTDDPDRLASIIAGLEGLAAIRPVICPLHPRTRASLERAGLRPSIHFLDPVGYLEMLWLLDHCALVATDSGGVQKEAYFHGKPCITLRDSTEWTELIALGVNVLVGADPAKIVSEGRARLGLSVANDGSLYGGGKASATIVEILARSAT